MTDATRPSSAESDAGGWWVISDTALKDMLFRAAQGEDPDLLLMEHYANSHQERP